eukprot:3765797-Prymnesium_polylepis.1
MAGLRLEPVESVRSNHFFSPDTPRPCDLVFFFDSTTKQEAVALGKIFVLPGPPHELKLVGGVGGSHPDLTACAVVGEPG